MRGVALLGDMLALMEQAGREGDMHTNLAGCRWDYVGGMRGFVPG